MQHIGNLFGFIGGLGMFLYGMNIMAEGLQKSAGNKMKQLLGYLTNNRLLGVLVGALVTAIIQSSSATTVMVVGFVNAQIINLTQAAGVIMGANIGTTITAWLVSASEWSAFLKPEFIAPLILGIGAFVLMFAKKEKYHQFSEIAIGFGILFIGLSFMSDSISIYRESPIFSKAFAVLGGNPILGILTGAVVTAIIQSSSASVGILQTLAMNGIVNWRSAVFITLGQNIGTCVTALLSSIGANKTAKRAAVIHLLFNVMGAILFGIIMVVFFTINQVWAVSQISSTQISIFHTIFNVTNTIILFPFANLLVKLSGKIVKDTEDAEEELDEEELTMRHLDTRIMETPTFAVNSGIEEIVHMGEVTMKNYSRIHTEMLKDKPSKSRLERVEKTENYINDMETMLAQYFVQVSTLAISEQQRLMVNNLHFVINDIERIGDYVKNIADFIERNAGIGGIFSDGAKEDLRLMSEKVGKAFELSINSIASDSMELADQVMEVEEEVDKIEAKIREKHINRLSKESCKVESGVIFLDIINCLEKISDHAENIAKCVKNEQTLHK
ncbi:MAG: Na/Pi cotransporter family protein [Anaerostipes sp.]|uniref:Na/Pi cotransporter family protein n=1 Tax=Anaerostipes sp. 992a TaxID=1261637 RepID=UPI0009522343|nr:Na/Pi cotransporter family protein [Anaerostipes sp. 992a]MCI5952926.1 Na/Pi cotransporter family protein [Anaerostipes sp.]MDD5969186.1 Na/Pi cotransporter family protein [Anaerostipes sp.]OLR63754.1 Na/Pi cotransporter [Anaerostipes sp. 992a]